MADAVISLAGKRVVVIGGSSGIGFAVATIALELDAEVVIASSSPANVDSAVTRLPGATGVAIDLRDEANVYSVFEDLGAFNHLAITAGDWGGSMFGPLRDLDLAASRESLAVRFWGALAVVKHASRTIAANGSITLTSGMLAHRPRRGGSLVAAVAGAVEHLTRGLAIDLAPVRVNAVCPGLILTDHVKQMPPEMLQAFVGGLPLPRGASPNEAATAYVHLMLNSYVTGQILRVDGGGSLV